MASYSASLRGRVSSSPKCWQVDPALAGYAHGQAADVQTWVKTG